MPTDQTNKPRYQVGQVVYLERWSPHRTIDKQQVDEWTIKKVGRKWIHCGPNHRFDRETGLADGDGYQSPGQVWLSREQLNDYLFRRDEWRSIREIVANNHDVPPNASLHHLRELTRVLLLEFGVGIKTDEPINLRETKR